MLKVVFIVLCTGVFDIDSYIYFNNTLANNVSNFLISIFLLRLILICAALVHNSTSQLKSKNFPAFSVDHILIEIYGKE